MTKHEENSVVSGVGSTVGFGVIVCGENAVLPARISGCGLPILTITELYRCTDCDIPFHKNCAKKHFNGHTLTAEHVNEMTPEEVDRAYAALTPNAS